MRCVPLLTRCLDGQHEHDQHRRGRVPPGPPLSASCAFPNVNASERALPIHIFCQFIFSANSYLLLVTLICRSCHHIHTLMSLPSGRHAFDQPQRRRAPRGTHAPLPGKTQTHLTPKQTYNPKPAFIHAPADVAMSSVHVNCRHTMT
jgi:hypothetical protein